VYPVRYQTRATGSVTAGTVEQLKALLSPNNSTRYFVIRERIQAILRKQSIMNHMHGLPQAAEMEQLFTKCGAQPLDILYTLKVI
jgi:hypothetical protein